jgi:AraC-like DNA-binding protein
VPGNEETQIARWSTSDVAPADRFSYWGDALSSAFVPTSLGGVDPFTCESEIRRTRLGSIDVAEHRGSAHFCKRNATAVARSGAHHFNLILLVDGEWNMTQRGHIRLRPGDLTLHDSDFVSSMSTDARYRAINLRLTESFVREWLPNPTCLSGQRLSPQNSRWAHVLSSFVGQLSPDFVVRAPLPSAVLTEQVGALLALVAAEMHGGSPPPTVGLRSLREQIQDLLQQRCQERSLVATDIATALGISTRSLHRTLAARGETFGSLLIQARLESAVRMLHSPLFDRLTTAEIGRRSGFSDASHFAKAVRGGTGRTPLQIRRDRTS